LASLIGVEIAASKSIFRYEEFSAASHTLMLIVIGGLLAFCMEVAEFMVVTFASSLSLAIIGVLKVRKFMTFYIKISLIWIDFESSDFKSLIPITIKKSQNGFKSGIFNKSRYLKRQKSKYGFKSGILIIIPIFLNDLKSS
jgi:hypothetical protein